MQGLSGRDAGRPGPKSDLSVVALMRASAAAWTALLTKRRVSWSFAEKSEDDDDEVEEFPAEGIQGNGTEVRKLVIVEEVDLIIEVLVDVWFLGRMKTEQEQDDWLIVLLFGGMMIVDEKIGGVLQIEEFDEENK